MLYFKFFSSIQPRVKYEAVSDFYNGPKYMGPKIKLTIEMLDPDLMARQCTLNHSRSSSYYNSLHQFFIDVNEQLCYLYLHDFITSDECKEIIEGYLYRYVDKTTLHEIKHSLPEDLTRRLSEWITMHYGSYDKFRHQCATKLSEYYENGIDFYLNSTLK